MPSIDLRISVRRFPFRERSMQQYLSGLLAALAAEFNWSFDLAVSVWICGDRAMRRLNRSYRGLDRPTDVLSFPQETLYNGRRAGKKEKDSKVHQPVLLGDVVIDWPYACRQARRYNVTEDAELERLAVHGMVHLAGFDHERSSKEEALMEKWEKRVLYRLKKEGHRLRK